MKTKKAEPVEERVARSWYMKENPWDTAKELPKMREKGIKLNRKQRRALAAKRRRSS